jgi:hypothetical protein
MKADGCDMVLLGTVIRETIGAMSEPEARMDVTFPAPPTNVLKLPALGKEAVEGLYAASGFEIPYEDTAKGKVKDWLANYKKMFSTDANTQAIIGYNAVSLVPRYRPDQVLQARLSANTVTQVQQIEGPLGAGEGWPDP